MKKLVTLCVFVAVTALITPSLGSAAPLADAPCGCGWPIPDGYCCGGN